MLRKLLSHLFTQFNNNMVGFFDKSLWMFDSAINQNQSLWHQISTNNNKITLKVIKRSSDCRSLDSVTYFSLSYSRRTHQHIKISMQIINVTPYKLILHINVK